MHVMSCIISNNYHLFPKTSVFAKSRTSLANRYKRFGIQTVAAIVAIIMKGKVQSDAYKLSCNRKAQRCNISFVIKVPEVSEECHFSCVLNRPPVLFLFGGGDLGTCWAKER